MKLTQETRNKILENYCKARYHDELQQHSNRFLLEIENIVRKHFSDFDFEGAKKFKGYISYQDDMYISGFYDDRRKARELGKSLFFIG